MESRAVIDRAIIEKAFLTTLIEDLGAVVILDGVDELAAGYRIRGHDLRGELPEILIPKLESLELKERVEIEACKLCALAMRGH